MVKNHEGCKNFYDVIRLGEVVHMDLSDPEEVTYLFIRNQTEDTKIYFSFTDNTCRYFSIDYPENY